MTQTPPPTRAAALDRLTDFVPHAGRDYATRRNYDLPDRGHPHVSQLSPYLRHRLLSEPDVLRAVLDHHDAEEADKFIAEVFWRTYWKGWLEMRPGVWADYLRDLDRIDRTGVAEAAAGDTDVSAFNDWMAELRDTGYLHNHARMWVASIWIFTLGLPWQAGADLFMRHLLDGDPASNTLSWRWVAGLQTPGKHYLARSSNISKFTEGRHNPEWRLNTEAEPLSGPSAPERRDLPEVAEVQPCLRTGVLLHEDDLSPDLRGIDAVTHAGLLCVAGRSPGEVSPKVAAFASDALANALKQYGDGQTAGPLTASVTEVADWARAADLEQIVTPYAPVGPVASALRRLRKEVGRDIAVVQVRRPFDTAAWPHATHGFFRFKKQIPDLLGQMDNF